MRVYTLVLASTAILWPAVGTSQVVPRLRQDVIPLIVMDDVPLVDAIRNLARQAGINYILDPRIAGTVGVENQAASQPKVSLRWESLSAEQALGRVLEQHRMTMLASPAPSVMRITFTNEPVRANAQIEKGTNAVIPLIVMDSVPLPDAIRNLANTAKLEIALDPKQPVALAGANGKTLSDFEVSLRWENLTGEQALAALLDNFDLAMVREMGTSTVQIVPNKSKVQPPR